MKSLKNRFKLFYKKFAHLEMVSLIENFAVFDGYPLDELELGYEIEKNIEKNVFGNFSELKKLYEKSLLKHKILRKLALGDRKQYAIYRSNEGVSQPAGRVAYKELYQENIIEKERSREESYKRKGQMIKKELRGYLPEDKIRFTKNFDRFWYSFIYPHIDNEGLMVQKECEKSIDQGFDKFVSLTFEELSNELIKDSFWNLNIVENGSYWDINSEYDILAKRENGKYIVGECKWTNQKICKNILNKLQNKAKYLKFPIEKYALFSKNGYSRSILKEKDIILFNLDDFKVLIKEKDGK